MRLCRLLEAFLEIHTSIEIESLRKYFPGSEILEIKIKDEVEYYDGHGQLRIRDGCALSRNADNPGGLGMLDVSCGCTAKHNR
jgi:hypothetical protein